MAMSDIEYVGVAVGLIVICVETIVLMRMATHVQKLEKLTERLDDYVLHMDKHIDLMDERIVKIKDDISLVCKQVGVNPKK
jgi:hypothetical protein